MCRHFKPDCVFDARLVCVSNYEKQQQLASRHRHMGQFLVLFVLLLFLVRSFRRCKFVSVPCSVVCCSLFVVCWLFCCFVVFLFFCLCCLCRKVLNTNCLMLLNRAKGFRSHSLTANRAISVRELAASQSKCKRQTQQTAPSQ